MGYQTLGTVLVGRYEIVERVGNSPDGALYRAREAETGTLYLLKEVGARTHERAALGSIVHPNLPRLQDEFDSDGLHFLVLSDVGQVSLQQMVGDNGPCTEEQVRWVAAACCSALACLHGQSPPVVFRHVRPSNLFLDDHGKITLLDAGRPADDAGNRTSVRASRRRTVDALPTDGYAPPEPHRGLDAAGDVYALGATLYFLLTGLSPPPSADMALGQMRLLPLGELRADVSPRMQGAIERMMTLDHADRPATMGMVATLLDLESPTSDETSGSPRTGLVQGRLDHSLRPRRLGEVLNDRYHIEQVLGRGGMGAVYLATHLELEEPVAIKEMTPPLADPETVEDCILQFRIEARILNRLRHPNLPRVYDFFEAEGRHYLVMDYIRGVTLEKAPPPSEATALTWASALCDVLGYLHRQDPPVIFRDLKPTNIMLEDDGSIHLIDFGIAKVFEPDAGASTRTILQGAVSHGYAAPEQYGGGTDERVDVYSLGATIYFLLSRTVPPRSVELALGQSTLPPLKQVRPDVSERTSTAVEWMMAFLREDRPRTMEEVRQALGLSETEAPFGPKASLPMRIGRLLREEFHHFFPAPWLARPTLMDPILAALSTRGQAPVVCLQGDAGVGKSRLMSEVGEALRDSMISLPVVRGSRSTRQQPFGALVGACRDLVRAGGEACLARVATRLNDVTLHMLAQLLPEMGPIDVAAPLPAVAPSERSRLLLEGFRVLLEEVSEGRTLLLMLDDIQWMDSGTLRLVDALLSGTGVAVLAARQDRIEAKTVDEALERWGRHTPIVIQPVPALTRTETRAYLEKTLPPLDQLDRYADSLQAITAGNVLLLEELVRWMVVRHLFEDRKAFLALRDLQANLLPNGVEDSVRRRLEMLPLDAQEL
ncbi:MAG TPA: protein kinase, partial [Candidatus Xenobia bacterium]